MVQSYIRVLETLAARMVQLEAEVSDLKAKWNRNSPTEIGGSIQALDGKVVRVELQTSAGLVRPTAVRWKIEGHFQEMTAISKCEVNALGFP